MLHARRFPHRLNRPLQEAVERAEGLRGWQQSQLRMTGLRTVHLHGLTEARDEQSEYDRT